MADIKYEVKVDDEGAVERVVPAPKPKDTVLVVQDINHSVSRVLERPLTTASAEEKKDA